MTTAGKLREYILRISVWVARCGQP